VVSHLKAKNIKHFFFCYHVQISIKMSQQTKSDIFHTKMLQNALWCHITRSKCMLCNILEYCSQTLNIQGHRVLQLILFLFMTLWLLAICYWMCFCSRRAYHIENMVDIKNFKNVIMQQFVNFKYRIWWYHDWIFFNPTNFFW
jgi:hypothetical protein